MVERFNTYIPKCRECGKEHRGLWAPDVRLRLLTERLCFLCDYWLAHVRRSADPSQARIHGQLYYILPDAPSSELVGTGGAPRVIKFLDGRSEPLVHTRNLWTCGPIPEEFRDRLADNALMMDYKGEKEWQEGPGGAGWEEWMRDLAGKFENRKGR